MRPGQLRPRRPRPTRISQLEPLETRQLLSGLTASWFGQNAQDHVGPYRTLKPDGIQDIQIRLSDIPAHRAILSAELLGLGGSHWVYNTPGNHWAAALLHTPGATVGDLFVGPDRLETGRPFNLIVTFDDGSRADVWFQGGSADPNLRMPDASLNATWVGQSLLDRTGLGPAVGPDGRIDAEIRLTGLAANNPIVSARLSDSLGREWVYGLNHEGRHNAELLRSPSEPSTAAFWFQPERDLAGALLTLEVVYATGHTDSTQLNAGPTSPAASVAPAPSLPTLHQGVTAAWQGQSLDDTQAPEIPRGSARFQLQRLPAGRSLAGIVLTGESSTTWLYQAANAQLAFHRPEPPPRPITWLPHPSNPARGTLVFAPDRSAPSHYTIRLIFDDGSMAVVNADSGLVDLGLLSAPPRPERVVARPGDDLNALATAFGRIELAPGVYPLNRPLVLAHPTHIIAPLGNASLQFTQSAEDAPWDAAILIHSGNTRLEGFAVQFTGPVRWNTAVSYGPALIATTDHFDRRHSDPKHNVELIRLNLVSPPPLTPGEEAPRALRLTTASSGRMTQNQIYGGMIEFFGGPWEISSNTFRGTPAGTWAWDVIAAHDVVDLSVRDNLVAPLPNSGRIWRFLVITGDGRHVSVERNQIQGLGAPDTAAENVNANEIILTEAYTLRFEGRLLALSPNRLWLDIPRPQGTPIQTGDLVAVVAGLHAGATARVAQVVSPTRILLDAPLPAGSTHVAIGRGFSNTHISDNLVDLTGNTIASALALVGFHAGTRVLNNTLIGGGETLRISAYPSESPVHWGWSRMPWLNGEVIGNTLVNSAQGASLATEHGPAIKSTAGRLYLSALVANNNIQWSPGFLAARAAAGLATPTLWTLGNPQALDPTENQITWRNNFIDVPQDTHPQFAIVHAARVNGLNMIDTRLPFDPTIPGPPAFLRLVNDSGSSHTDHLTNDPRLEIGPAQKGASYEYRVGTNSHFTTLGNATRFLPELPGDGPITVHVRALSAAGIPGPEKSLHFTLDSTPPTAHTPRLDPSLDTGLSNQDGITRARSLLFHVDAGDAAFAMLERDGVPVASGTTPALADPAKLPNGTFRYRLRLRDHAGNESTSPSVVIQVDNVAPVIPNLIQTSPLGFVHLEYHEDGVLYEYRVNNRKYLPIDSRAAFLPEGLLFGSNTLDIRATDAAGNRGARRTFLVDVTPPAPAGRWLGQDGHDFVGPSHQPGPDTFQDVHIQIGGMTPGKIITFLDIQGLGGSRWQFAGTAGHWSAVVTRDPASTTADIFIQPDRAETGRPFEVRIAFNDGSEAFFWINGGIANPKRRMPGAPRK